MLHLDFTSNLRLAAPVALGVQLWEGLLGIRAVGPSTRG